MNALATRTLDHCLACGSRALARAAMRYEWHGASFPAARCRACGMLFLRVQPIGDTLARMYSAEYFEQDFRCGRSDARSTDESAFRQENDGLLDRFESWRGQARLLEVGCAAGLLLKRARERGWHVTGVELSGDAVAHARALGLEVRQGTLEAAALPADSYDVVYMGDVLEHVPDCRATLAEVARVLAPGGHAVVRGPITTHSLARRLGLALYGALGRDIVLREPPYHLWEFRPGSLGRLARTVGLEVVAIEQSKIPPGPRYGKKSALQELAMNAIDALNEPLTRSFNMLGDRAMFVARKRAR
ncbi:MAG: class I SAM-dependent methyltransferase [Candidatus Eisenbacteria bacterium]